MIKYLKIFLFLFSAILVFFVLFGDKNEVIVENADKIGASVGGGIFENSGDLSENASPIIGVKCDNYDRRPIAVMMANDPVTRPLSGISSADVIVEMQVITGSITRIMALFVCEEPAEIGALRSARHDFIPLAMGLDGIFVHWGGSHFALDKLDGGVMDNIDAMYNPFSAFYRKSGLPAPHNGFTSYDRLYSAAKKLGYDRETKFDGYDFEGNDGCVNCRDGELIVGYAKPYEVRYEYKAGANAYFRSRNGYPEIDKLNGEQVEIKNVVIMKTFSRQIEGQYNDVDVEGSGEAVFYKNGEEVFGLWRKNGDDLASPLEFFDKNNEKIKFARGKIIIEIMDYGQFTRWNQN